ncbi:NAD(P)H-dependent oxidoreductase subunit E [Micromonospora sp. NPDC049559]|uniref:NAD(P)H-dependent oxidoreductase subunit E n=1 Tax=Micromonospora sp. NPDC049559 TaxID=3155923 RepID=UPI00342D1872
MDLHFLDAVADAEERAAVDELLGEPDSGWDGGQRHLDDWRTTRGGHAARSRRDQLLPALHAVNDRVGWISQGALNYICQRLTIPPADAYGVATFYALFSVRPRPKRVVHLCTDIACKAAGVDAVRAGVRAELGPPGRDAGGVVWQESPCLGVCERAPAALVLEAGRPALGHVVAPVGTEQALLAARAPVVELAPEPDPALAVPQAGDPGLVLLRRIGVADPTSLDDYRAHGGYQALREAFRLGPAGVIREVTDAKLVGRGGAAFPTGRKWDAVARQPADPHYLVCNADESEPGTFKDRVLLEGDPFALVEAMTVAAYATGCRRGFLYLRGEYPRALARLENALAQARARGLLGADIMGQGFDFDIEIRRGAGAYICGEETAIFGSIEGLRGEPRSKPPFPVERGLFGKPTVVNNVETLVNVLPILAAGGPAYAAVGTPTSTGTKLYCVSGAVARPGVYELPFGANLRELLELAGRPEGSELTAVLMGGAAGSFIRADEVDIPLTFEGTRAAGTALGSGVVLALDEGVDLGGILLRIAGFFRDESCGQCVPCRVGTVRQEEALARLTGGRPLGSTEQDLALLREVGQAMRDASICGLGQTAWNAVESAIDRLGAFREATPS